MLLRGIAWITLVVAPVLLLLTIQIQFLPYQSGLVAWTQRIALLFDLALVWWLWRKVLAGGESDATAPRTSLIAVGTGLLFSLLAIAFSCAIATFPGEWLDQRMWAVTVHNVLFSAEPNEVTHRRFPFSNTLVLPGLNVYEGLGIDDPEKAKWRDFVFRPRGRDLRGAIFTFASLPRVDFTGADLQGARLTKAQLQGASLTDAYLQGGRLMPTLQGREPLEPSTRLQGARRSTRRIFEGALFNDAQLQGASFSEATLKATDLSGAYLWRSNQARIPAVLSAIPMVDGDKNWQPRWQDFEMQDQAWDDKNKAYAELRTSLQSLPSGPLRDAALERIVVLDCSSPDKTLQSCDPTSAPPTEAAKWRNAVVTNMVGVKPYRAALAESLQALFCSGDENEALVVRTVAKFGQLQQAGPAARDLIAKLLTKSSSDCPVAASLTDADRATLLRIQQQITSFEEQDLENRR